MTGTPWLTVTTRPAPTVIDGRACRTRAELFTELARVLRFPAYFGRNWDALADCLRDVVPAELVIADAGELLADAPEHDTEVLLRIVGDLAGDGLQLTLCTTTDDEAALRRRVDAAGVQ